MIDCNQPENSAIMLKITNWKVQEYAVNTNQEVIDIILSDSPYNNFSTIGLNWCEEITKLLNIVIY
jgi:hypothetical protein